MTGKKSVEIFNEWWWVTHSRALIELLSKSDKSLVRYDSSVKESMHDLNRKLSFIEVDPQLLSRHVMKLLMDQKFDQMVWIFEYALTDEST